MDTVAAYETNAERFAASYEAVSTEAIHEGLLSFIPSGRDRTALDIGAGSGRDAAWLAAQGYDVVAVEPSAAMKAEGQRRHGSARIRWVDDRLPSLARVHQLGIAFDLILLSAVWMHVPPSDRPRAFRKIVTLLKPGGVLLLTLREGACDDGRCMWPAPFGEIEALARDFGLAVLKSARTEDRLGREGVHWTNVALKLPDDGSGALPLLRGIILKDDKSSTYKLGLLRSIARIADSMPSLASPAADGDEVTLPMGAVALVWVRLYLPLIEKGLPQRPGNSGPDGIGFAGAGFRALLEHRVNAQDLRIGARLLPEIGRALVQALADASDLIARMPAHFTTYPRSDQPVFLVNRQRLPRRIDGVVIDRGLLELYGRFTVPGPVWRTLLRLGSWIEPVLLAEWSRQMMGYSANRTVFDRFAAEQALSWIDPDRDTRLAREILAKREQQGRKTNCVWSGAAIKFPKADIDHCMPWSAWPCNDLWNLLPSTDAINRHKKRERIPSAARLAEAKERIVRWWEEAWLDDPVLRWRFEREAEVSLPIDAGASAEEVFAGLEWRRLRLRTDQQVGEWV